MKIVCSNLIKIHILNSISFLLMHEDKGLYKKWDESQLMTALNCLSYGVNCLYFDRVSKKLYNCLLSVHQQYINILHIIIQGKASVLFEMQQIENISDKDIYIQKTLKDLGYNNFIIIYKSVLDNYSLVMHSENEKNVIWEGLQYFIYQSKQFYSKISRLDPFKAETMMLFMEADVDGSNLLDIEECHGIFDQLKINQSKQEILNNIMQINRDLYQKQNLKRPKGFQMSMLTPIGFEYLLRYYSMKESLAPIFNSLCPIFKVKHKKYKKSITEILKHQNKPLMSSPQLQQFIQVYLKREATIQQCNDIIRSFPVYDGEGNEIPEEQQLMSFHHFCNYIFVPQNSLMNPSKTRIHHDMSRPLNDYFIYTSHNTYLASSNINSDSKLEMYQICLKKGCRSLELDIQNIGKEIIVKHKKSKNYILLQDVLKTIKNLGFGINSYPILLSIENICSKQGCDRMNEIFTQEIGPSLFIIPKGMEKQLPSPLQLKNKILLMEIPQSDKMINKHQNQNNFSKKISFLQSKVDFDRKGLTCRNYSLMSEKNILDYQTVQEKNLTDYTRKLLVRSIPDQKKLLLQNYDPMPMFRNGIQLIALNLQKEDIYHYIIHSKFIENGGNSCGYLLKPHWMQGQCMESLYASDFPKPLLSIKLKVLAGQKYVLSSTLKSTFWLEVFIKGTKMQESKNKKFKSEPKNDGFYADFGLDCEFSVFCSDLATIVFSVTDQSDQILAARAITVNTMREGLRTLQLLGPGMQLQDNSYILVECTIEEVYKAKKNSIFS